jgi:predicted nucleic acid-binding protein
MVLLNRRRAVEGTAELMRTALNAIETGRAAIPVAARTELLLTASDSEVVRPTLADIPIVVAPDDVAEDAGLMGAFLRKRGRSIQLPDLLIAATAIWLDVPLLHWDSDFARSHALALSTGSEHPGAELWRRLTLHPASLTA